MSSEVLFINPGKPLVIRDGRINGDLDSLMRVMVRTGSDGDMYSLDRISATRYELRCVSGSGFTKSSVFGLFPAKVIPAICGM